MSIPERTPWRLIALLFLAGTLAACQYAKIPWMLPGLSEITSMSALQQALLLSVVGALGAVGGTFAGALCQRTGLVRTLHAGLMLSIVGALLPLLGSGYTALLVARLIESVGHMAIVVAVPTLMLSLAASQDRSRVMTLWSCYFTLTFIIVALTAPAMLALAGWRGFAILHALLLSGVLFASRRFPVRPQAVQPAGAPLAGHSQASIARVDAQPDKTDTKSGREASGRAPGSMSWHRVAAAQWRLLSTPRLLIVPLTFSGYTLLFVALVSVLPNMLSDTPGHVFLLGFMLPGCSLLGTLGALWLLKRQIRPWRMVRAAAIVLLVLGASLGLLPAHGAAAIPLSLMVFLMLGLLPAGIIGSLPDIFGSGDPDITLVNGALVQFGNLGNFVGPPILALLLSSVAWSGIGAYLFAGAMLVLMCLLLLARAVEARSRLAGES